MVLYKKGSMVDLIVIPFVLVVFAIFVVIIYKVQFEMEIGINESDIYSGSKEIMHNNTGYIQNAGNWLFKGLFIGSILFTLISAFFVKTHPIMFAVSIGFLILFGFFSIVMMGMYQEVEADSELASTAAVFTFQGWVISNLPKIIVVVGILLMILLYMKNPLD
jgi:hypothetical protein